MERCPTCGAEIQEVDVTQECVASLLMRPEVGNLVDITHHGTHVIYLSLGCSTHKQPINDRYRVETTRQTQDDSGWYFKVWYRPHIKKDC